MSCKVMVARKVATSWYSNKAPAVLPHLDPTLVVMAWSLCSMSWVHGGL